MRMGDGDIELKFLRVRENGIDEGDTG